jgi:hypothetical protein
VRTFWKSRFTKGASYFGRGDLLAVVEVVPQALRKSAPTATQTSEKYFRLCNGKSY